MGKYGQVSNKNPHFTICILTAAPIVLGISLSVTKDRKTRGHPLLPLGYPKTLTATLLVLLECRASLQATQGLASQLERGACPRGIHGPIDRTNRGCSGLSDFGGCDSMRDCVSRSSYLASEPGFIPFFFGVELAGIDLSPLRCLAFVFSCCAPIHTYGLEGGTVAPLCTCTIVHQFLPLNYQSYLIF